MTYVRCYLNSVYEISKVLGSIFLLFCILYRFTIADNFLYLALGIALLGPLELYFERKNEK